MSEARLFADADGMPLSHSQRFNWLMFQMEQLACAAGLKGMSEDGFMAMARASWATYQVLIMERIDEDSDT